jgi:hypothetical protein
MRMNSLTGIATTCLNLGSSVMILITLLCWYVFGWGVLPVIYVAGFASLAAAPLFWYSRYLSYVREINPDQGHKYMPIGVHHSDSDI